MIIADSFGRGYGFARGVYNYITLKEDRDFEIILSDIKRTDFKDGEFKLRIVRNIRRKKCFFIHDPNKDACRWVADLLFVLEAMRFSSPEEINVVLPYTRFARQDRKDESRVSVNANAIAGMITRYADRGMTIDLHSPQIQEYFGIPFDNLFSSPVLVNYLLENHKELLDNLVIVSPDEGGAKRAGSFQKRLSREGVNAELAICYKRRSGEDVVGEMRVMGEVKGKNCLLVDDIIDTGGTMVESAKVLRGKGANKIAAYGTHGLFVEGFEKFEVFDNVLTSDSLFNESKGNLEVISLVDLFGEAIYRTVVGQSLSGLFE